MRHWHFEYFQAILLSRLSHFVIQLHRSIIRLLNKSMVMKHTTNMNLNTIFDQNAVKVQ